jgi:hypothetical protein
LHIGFHQLSTMLASVAAEDSIVTFTGSSWQRFFHLPEVRFTSAHAASLIQKSVHRK